MQPKLSRAAIILRNLKLVEHFEEQLCKFSYNQNSSHEILQKKFFENDFLLCEYLSGGQAESKMRTLEERITNLEKRTWTVKRKQYTLPALKMVTFSNDEELKHTIPNDVLPWTTRAVIVSIKCDQWAEQTTKSATLGLKIQQTGNNEGGWVEYTSPMNDFYYETLVPWDSVKGNKITFKATGSSVNKYTIAIVGYVTQ